MSSEAAQTLIQAPEAASSAIVAEAPAAVAASSSSAPVDSRPDGVFALAGCFDWKIAGRDNQAPADVCLFSPTVLENSADLRFVSIVSASSASHVLLLTKDGQCYSFGRNESGQCGTGTLDSVNAPTLISGMSKHKIVHASVGKQHSAVVTEEGLVFTFGSNKQGQLGLGSAKPEPQTTPKQVKELTKIKQVSCGGEFTIALSEEGQLFSFGSPQYSQLGLGSDRAFIPSAGRIVYEPVPTPSLVKAISGKKIVHLASGNNHSIAVDSDDVVYTWGFGGYGRLGTGKVDDVPVPKPIAPLFNVKRVSTPPKITSVACGAITTAIITSSGLLFLFGKIKAGGDSITSPQLYADLQGWNVKRISLGNGTAACLAESSTIAFGQATYGELGLGPNKKSSARATKVEALEGIPCFATASACATTFYLVDPEKSAKLPRKTLSATIASAASSSSASPASPEAKAAPSVDELACSLCRGVDDEDSMLLCDGCDKAFHMRCLSPPLKEIPEGQWFCVSCKSAKGKGKGKRASASSAGSSKKSKAK